MYINQYSKNDARSSKSAILNYPQHKTQKFQNSPFYRTITAWNNVPSNISTTTTTKNFKKQYQRHVIKSTYPMN